VLWAYSSFVVVSLGYAAVAGMLCMVEPQAAGSGIPQIKAYLNGVNLHKTVRVRTLILKSVGMVFSVASGLPIGKEGPMIHAGAIVGAAMSQGRGMLFGIDTSWTKYQDLRNDCAKRDFVTIGAAAGVAAAFNAPIGGIMFTLEEGATFWSATLTFRCFFCAMITELTINLITGIGKNENLLGIDRPESMVSVRAICHIHNCTCMP
jgi:chloride channel 7